VRANTDVHLALTAFNFTSHPMIEVFIGGWNNSRSAIRRNQATPDLINISTPNILRNDDSTLFRVTWANFFVLVFRDGEDLPLFGVMMPDWYPIRFYGIRTV
jgi:Farnesoic acid 0-methyl transferase